MTTSTWTYRAGNLSAGAVALIFAQTEFDPPREPGEVVGGWEGGRFHGTFSLKDGRKQWTIESLGDVWTIKDSAEITT